MGPPGLLVLLMAALFLSGCTHLDEETLISPAPVGQRPADFGLGPGIRPLSSGPGDKGSPTWSPSGERVAFVVDGYVVEKQINAREGRRQTTRDLAAKRVVWMGSGERMMILAKGFSAVSAKPFASDRSLLHTVYRAIPDDSLSVDKVATRVSAVSPIPDSENLLVALRAGSSSQLAVVRGSEEVQPYGTTVEGDIIAVSVIPDGSQAILAAQKPGPEGSFELLSYTFSENRLQRLASLRDNLEIFGTPQWTTNGIYYVAGEETEGDTPVTYSLYRLAPGSNQPELAPGTGEDFVASSLRRDPKGERLAVIGRRNPSSPDNLYILRPGVGNLVAMTTNENMEVKTKTEDLAWSNDGERVAIVARTMLSEPRVYDVPASALVSDFYNVYEVPITEIAEEGPA